MGLMELEKMEFFYQFQFNSNSNAKVYKWPEINSLKQEKAHLFKYNKGTHKNPGFKRNFKYNEAVCFTGHSLS